MTFAPIAPTIIMAPEEIAPETFVIHQVQAALGQPLFVYINSMVILGAEPVIVDTGTPANREQWLEDVFSLVEPEDVQWVFLSHDDVDHSGNLDEVMTACPNAKLVCNWAMVERHTNCFNFPLDRCRWVMDGESLRRRRPDAARVAAAGLRLADDARPVRPDDRRCTGPSTRSRRRCPIRSMGVADLDEEFWRELMWVFAIGAVSPWLAMLDPEKYGRYVDRVQNLDITTIAALPHAR